MKKIRVLIVDDHAVLRAGLRTLLNLQSDFEVVGEAAEGPEALEKVQRLQPDVVLMDITLPGMEGLEATKRLKKTHPNVKVLILTMHEDRRYLYSALKAGASGYVVKRAADTCQRSRSPGRCLPPPVHGQDRGGGLRGARGTGARVERSGAGGPQAHRRGRRRQ